MDEVTKDEFYVGYQPKAPRNIARRVTFAVGGILGVTGLAAAILGSSQARLAPATFEFGIFRDFEGVWRESPYPTLSTSEASYLVVNPGKQGAGERPAIGQRVRFKGERIFRPEGRMIQLLPGSLTPLGGAPDAPAPVSRGRLTVTGEIVDTKCYLGVMNPGQGKVHRDCAARCLAGGIPPGLLTWDAAGKSRLYILTGPGSEAIGRQLVGFAGERVTLSGELVESGSLSYFRINPRQIQRK